MKWLKIFAVIIICPILIFLGLILFQKPFLSLTANGKVVAIAKRSLFTPILTDGTVKIYVGNEKAFSLWEDSFDGPIFIYPFADGKRFLCDYNDDTSLLDFVVDFRDSATNEPRSSGWPPYDVGTGSEIGLGNYTRTYMASRITNVVFETKGFVRLPNYAELAEVRSYLTSTNPTQIKAGYFNFFGSKESLLLDLATNRKSVWPLAK